jgi:hypothetical protein
VRADVEQIHAVGKLPYGRARVTGTPVWTSHRRVVERTISWLLRFKRLGLRYDHCS